MTPVQVDLAHAGWRRRPLRRDHGRRPSARGDRPQRRARPGRAFVDIDLADELSIIDLNIISTVRLAKLVLRDMVARDEGRVLVTSSIASTMPGSFQAVYNASKSFLQSFTEALQNELKDTERHPHLADARADGDRLLRARRHGRRHQGRHVEEGRPGTGRAAGVRRADGGQGPCRRRRAQDQGAGGRRQGDARQAQGRDAPADGGAGLGGLLAGRPLVPRGMLDHLERSTLERWTTTSTT